MFVNLAFWTFFGLAGVVLTPTLLLAQVAVAFLTPLWNLLSGRNSGEPVFATSVVLQAL